MRNEMILEWANYNKKIKGLIQAKAPDHEKKDASNALDSFMNNTYAVTSKDVEFLVNNLADMKGLSSFKEFIAKLEEDTAIAILGQANTNQLPNNGSYSALNILNMIRNDIAFSDMQRAKSLVNESLLLFDYRMNIDSSANSHPYEFDFVFDEAEDVETNARVLEIAIRNGIPLSQDTVYNKLNIKAPETNDVLLKVQQTSSNLGF
jgi:phage gp29-like protein